MFAVVVAMKVHRRIRRWRWSVRRRFINENWENMYKYTGEWYWKWKRRVRDARPPSVRFIYKRKLQITKRVARPVVNPSDEFMDNAFTSCLKSKLHARTEQNSSPNGRRFCSPLSPFPLLAQWSSVRVW